MLLGPHLLKRWKSGCKGSSDSAKTLCCSDFRHETVFMTV